MALKDIVIKRNINRNVRKVQFANLDSAKTVSILYLIDTKINYDLIKDYIKKISDKGISVRSLGFVKNPEDIGRSYFGQSMNNFFSEKHITKMGKIKEVCVQEYINAKDDILINLTPSNNFFIEYVFALSKAKFKVSGIIDCKYSDMNLNYDRSKDLNYFISQIDHYLTIIKKG